MSSSLISNNIFNRLEIFAFDVPIGATGPDGDQGLDGLFGVAGEQGATGASGPTGNFAVSSSDAGNPAVGAVNCSDIFDPAVGTPDPNFALTKLHVLPGPGRTNISNLKPLKFNQLSFVEVVDNTAVHKYVPAYFARN